VKKEPLGRLVLSPNRKRVHLIDVDQHS